jgi:hypothetical protein
MSDAVCCGGGDQIAAIHALIRPGQTGCEGGCIYAKQGYRKNDPGGEFGWHDGKTITG